MERRFGYFTSPIFPQYYKPQYNSFKIVFDLYFINAIDLHYCYRIKIFFKKRRCVHLELKETKSITHFLLLKAYRFQCTISVFSVFLHYE